LDCFSIFTYDSAGLGGMISSEVAVNFRIIS
jgi:hypothetical protein